MQLAFEDEDEPLVVLQLLLIFLEKEILVIPLVELEKPQIPHREYLKGGLIDKLSFYEPPL